MADGRREAVWEHTGVIAAAALSVMRETMVQPWEINPYLSIPPPSGLGLTSDNLSVLKEWVS